MKKLINTQPKRNLFVYEVMMNKYIKCLISILSLAIIVFPSLINAQGFLKAEGIKIVNGEGEEIILKGMGLGGWMLQEGYMMQTEGSVTHNMT